MIRAQQDHNAKLKITYCNDEVWGLEGVVAASRVNIGNQQSKNED